MFDCKLCFFKCLYFSLTLTWQPTTYMKKQTYKLCPLSLLMSIKFYRKVSVSTIPEIVDICLPYFYEYYYFGTCEPSLRLANCRRASRFGPPPNSIVVIFALWKEVRAREQEENEYNHFTFFSLSLSHLHIASSIHSW